MKPGTKSLWDKQNQHPNDRWKFFRAVGEIISPGKTLYAGSYVDIAASFVFRNVTYVDMDRRAKSFFDDEDGIREIIQQHDPDSAGNTFSFVQSDYADLDLSEEAFDLLISLYAGPISEHCTQFLKVGGHLLVNSSHGDAALASLDSRYQLVGLVLSKAGKYRVSQDGLSDYLIAKKPTEITREDLIATNRGIAYTRPASAYLFRRTN